MNVDVHEARVVDLQRLRLQMVELNASFRPRYLHRFGNGVGFGAEFIHLLKSLACCLQRGVQLCLEANPTPVGFVVESGWRDYFEPKFTEVPLGWMSALNQPRRPRWSRLPFAMDAARAGLRAKTGCQMFSFDSLGAPPEQIGRPAVGLDLPYWKNMQLLAQLLWDLTPEVRARVDEFSAGRKPAGRYLGLHIRRGDKNTEVSYSPIEDYARAIHALNSPPTDVYVATDDIKVVQELSACLGTSFAIQFGNTGASGYDQSAFNKSDLDSRRRQIVTLMAELEILSDSEILVGSSDSNVYCLAEYFRASNAVIDLNRNRQ